ncbi:uncharacterized protein G2W53_029395 [Senna tora]|uniref:Uncharacterized protein n=1 Tax=Senna tora TaxID=362788 RepID=A0A834T5D4_9FABA|nr:uncharacterized protein G2W53_029395 [Senna tora]
MDNDKELDRKNNPPKKRTAEPADDESQLRSHRATEPAEELAERQSQLRNQRATKPAAWRTGGSASGEPFPLKGDSKSPFLGADRQMDLPLMNRLPLKKDNGSS